MHTNNEKIDIKQADYLFYILKDMKDDVNKLDLKIDNVAKELKDDINKLNLKFDNQINKLDLKFDSKIDSIYGLLFASCGGIIISILTPIILHFLK